MSPGSLKFERFGQCLGLEELGTESLCAKEERIVAEVIANNLHQASRSPILGSGD